MGPRFVESVNKTPSLETWRDSDFEHALETLTKSTFADGSVLSKFSEDQRQQLVAKLNSLVSDVDKNKNPFLKCRELLGSTGIAFAGLQVLCLKSDWQMEGLFDDCQFISGQLRRHIGSCAKYNQELEDYCGCAIANSEEDMLTFATARSAIYLYYLTGLDAVRRRLEAVPPFDWFRPFVKSMMIWQEDTYRRKIDLPVLLPPNVDALMHSAFFQTVAGGAKNPLATWEGHFSLKHSDVS